MRVVHLSTVHRSDDTRIFRKECRSLARAGHEVHYVVRYPHAAEEDGVRFHHIPEPARRSAPGRDHVARVHRLVARNAAAYRIARRLAADVYHVHDPELIPVAVLLRRGGARVVYDVHEDAVAETWTLAQRRPVEAWALRTAWRAAEGLARRALDAFVCATPHILALFPRERSVLVQNFPMLDELLLDEPPEYEDRGYVCAYVGGISTARGARTMVEAIGMLPDGMQPRLVLVGEFGSAAELEECRALAGWSRVEHRGFLDRAGVAQVLGSARVGLVVFEPHPEMFQAQPNKLFEYMSAGVPVVCSDFPLWREFVLENRCGFVADPTEPAAVAAAIQRVFCEPTQAACMGRRGRTAVERVYNWEAEAATLAALYRRLGS
jgi:glycosyltransferase involved in cell wall biosynthesis